MAVDPKLLSRLQPEFYGFQQPNGSFTMVRLRKLPPASDLDSRSEDRHLTEYQRTVMRSALSKYHGAKLSVMCTRGRKTLAYASEFRDFFRSLGWNVGAVRPVPAGDDTIVDVQTSVSSHYWNMRDPEAADLLSSFGGIKHRRRYVYDDAVLPDQIVLWVGPKSPDSFRPDDCGPPALDPKLGEHYACELVAQVPSMCPIIPQ
jgi:hypothetical protein